MDVMAGTTYELYLELTREVTPATGVTLDQTELTLTAGKTASLKATVQPDNTTDTIVWSSSKEEELQTMVSVVLSLRRRRPARLSSLRRAAP